MPRRPRIVFPQVPLHIVQRGNNRVACFFAEEDYGRYLHHLEELARTFECSVHAFVLMTNHVHLLLTPERRDSASLLMKHLGQRYVQYINRTYRRSGTLWEGRFRSCIVREDAYLLHCYRYIELNPVRARMVVSPQEYRWSSHPFNAEGAGPRFLIPHECYCRLGATEQARRMAYRELFRAALDSAVLTEIRHATNGNLTLGSDRFRRQIEEVLGPRAGRGRTGRPRKSREGFSALETRGSID